MVGSDLVPSARAAEILGVSQQEIRRLVRTGVLRGTLVANRTMVDRTSLEHRAYRPPAPGRARTPANAWGLLRLLAGVDVDFLGPVVRSRLRASLRDVTPDRLRQATARRATSHRYRLPARYVPAVRAERGLVLTGLSAVGDDASYDLVGSGDAGVDAYCTAQTRERLEKAFGLVVGDELSELTLRETTHLGLARGAGAEEPGVALVPAVCLDLMDSLDSRVVAAGRQQLQTLIDDYPSRARG